MANLSLQFLCFGRLFRNLLFSVVQRRPPANGGRRLWSRRQLAFGEFRQHRHRLTLPLRVGKNGGKVGRVCWQSLAGVLWFHFLFLFSSRS